MLIVAGCVGLGAWQIGWQAPAIAGELGATAAQLTTSAVGLGEPEFEYVGSSKCKKCHLSQHKTWAKTKMGQALETLKPGQAVEAKKKHNLDPEKDYTQDTHCLKCHTTGHGQAGGYAIPDPDNKKAVRTAKKLAGVGCESCHGPGSAYIKVFDDIQKTKRTYTLKELYAVGLTKMDETVCTSCHNDKGPTYDSSTPFNFDEMKEKDAHEHKELKLRE